MYLVQIKRLTNLSILKQSIWGKSAGQIFQIRPANLPLSQPQPHAALLLPDAWSSLFKTNSRSNVSFPSSRIKNGSPIFPPA